jgi:hypothetical protein
MGDSRDAFGRERDINTAIPSTEGISGLDSERISPLLDSFPAG